MQKGKVYNCDFKWGGVFFWVNCDKHVYFFVRAIANEKKKEGIRVIAIYPPFFLEGATLFKHLPRGMGGKVTHSNHILKGGR